MTRSTRYALVTLLTGFLAGLPATAQERIDGTVSVDGVDRSYSLYVHSGYDAERPNPVMLALHPFNPSRWNSVSWRDTLQAFAETNGLILVCPDGGSDGNLLSERADTLAATALLDSVEVWYSTDRRRTYVMGFSVGGGTTYVYGLSNAWRFHGYIPIGAAITPGQISDLKEFAERKPFFIINGGSDSPQARVSLITPLLIEGGGIVDSLILPGVGHTIDFQGRNQVFTDAFHWIDSVNLAVGASGVRSDAVLSGSNLRFAPNPIRRDEVGHVSSTDGRPISAARVTDLLGRRLPGVSVQRDESGTASIDPTDLAPGMYMLHVESGSMHQTLQFIVR